MDNKSLDLQLAQADKEAAIITLIGGGDPEGQSFWAYIAIPPSYYQKLLNEEITSFSNLESLGTVLCSGPGQVPPDDIKMWMEAEYGVNHNLLEDIAEFSEQQEAQNSDNKS